MAFVTQIYIRPKPEYRLLLLNMIYYGLPVELGYWQVMLTIACE